jgi:hypothetical protein
MRAGLPGPLAEQEGICLYMFYMKPGGLGSLFQSGTPDTLYHCEAVNLFQIKPPSTFN